ncbi:MAG: ABC transporter permease [Alicyclobacillaceae bacterium]|nr:ABC transporter permease [Alicyclobacillaceae bacterium]
MQTTLEEPVSTAVARPRRGRKFIQVFLDRKAILVGSLILLVMVVLAVFAPYIAPYSPYQQDLDHTLAPPSWQHLLGTDLFGRDELSRIIFGTRASLMVGVVSVAIAGGVGIALGLMAGYLGGIIDSLIMRIMDALMAIPPIILALSIGSALGGGLKDVMISLGIALIPIYARLMRGQVLSVREADYVIAGELSGSSNLRNMLVHVLPNCVSPLIVLITLNLGVAILAEAALSFLGLGMAPPGAAWGSMINDGYPYMRTNPLLSFAPGVAVMLVVVAFNLVGDALRDALDPKLRGSV